MSSGYKKLVPCIYLYKGNAVKDLQDITIVDTNPVKLANFTVIIMQMRCWF